MFLAEVSSTECGCGNHAPRFLQILLVIAAVVHARRPEFFEQGLVTLGKGRGDEEAISMTFHGHLAQMTPHGNSWLEPEATTALQQRDEINTTQVIEKPEAERRYYPERTAVRKGRPFFSNVHDPHGRLQAANDGKAGSTKIDGSFNRMIQWQIGAAGPMLEEILEEAHYASDTVPSWIHGGMLVCFMMLGVLVVCILHATKHKPQHGCATMFCLLCCWPCGILSVCFPVDEAPPDLVLLPESHPDLPPQRPPKDEGRDGRESANRQSVKSSQKSAQKPRSSKKAVSSLSRAEGPRPSI